MVTAASARSAGASCPPTAADLEKLQIWKDDLYEACQRGGAHDRPLNQADLLKLGATPRGDTEALLRTVQALCNDRLLVAVRVGNELAWKSRDASEAHKYTLCATDDQAMVYSLIDDADVEGIWSARIQRQTKMHDSKLNAVLKQLQSRGLVAQFKCVTHPTRRMYIKASMQPSEEATGGPWYTNQGFDVAFAEELQRLVYDLIKKNSGCQDRAAAQEGGRGSQPDGALLPSKDGAAASPSGRGKKRSADDISDDTPLAPPPPPPSGKKIKTEEGAAARPLLPFPAGYAHYRTVREIGQILVAGKIIDKTVLSKGNIQNIVDVLTHDGLIEPVTVGKRYGYRLTRVPRHTAERWSAGRPEEGSAAAGTAGAAASTGAGDRGDRALPKPYVNGVVEAPCGRCPVFDGCAEGGRVAPSKCEYFKAWLELDY